MDDEIKDEIKVKKKDYILVIKNILEDDDKLSELIDTILYQIDDKEPVKTKQIKKLFIDYSQTNFLPKPKKYETKSFMNKYANEEGEITNKNVEPLIAQILRDQLKKLQQ